jgi:hypothetical protein
MLLHWYRWLFVLNVLVRIESQQVVGIYSGLLGIQLPSVNPELPLTNHHISRVHSLRDIIDYYSL